MAMFSNQFENILKFLQSALSRQYWQAPVDRSVNWLQSSQQSLSLREV